MSTLLAVFQKNRNDLYTLKLYSTEAEGIAQAVADKSCAYDDDPAIFMLASKDSKKIEAVYEAGTQHNQSLEETFDILMAWRSLGFEIRVIQND